MIAMEISIERIVEQIRQVVSAVESVDYAFLFGSALKRLLPQSDVDILVGGAIDFDQKVALTATLSIRIGRNVDIVVTREARSELVLKAMSQGVMVFERNRETVTEDYLRNWRRFDDTIGLRRIKLERIRREYARG
jgi:predicted nucleotidyltransferase